MNNTVYILVRSGVFLRDITPQYFTSLPEAIECAKHFCRLAKGCYHHYTIRALHPRDSSDLQIETDAHEVAEVRATLNLKIQEREINVYLYT